MDVDGVPPPAPSGIPYEEDTPTCESGYPRGLWLFLMLVVMGIDTSIEAPPSLLPARKYCDITGLEARILLACGFSSRLEKVQAHYTDPATGLRYYDKNVYQLIKGLVGFPITHAMIIQTLTHALEHGCSAGLSGGARCEPYREVTRRFSPGVGGRSVSKISYGVLYTY